VKFRMAENSLFAILLRSSWWISFAIAAFVIGLSLMALPPQYSIYGAAGSLPFLVITAIVGVRTLRAPGATRIAATEQAVRAMSWAEFSAALEEAFRQDGFTIARSTGGDIDLEMSKGWKRVVVSAKRWKVARTGVEPLRAAHAALEAREAHECLYVTVGEVTDVARKYAADHRIRLVEAGELARLLPRAGRGPGRPVAASRG